MVVRWSDGSFLEDQDHWWMAGIHECLSRSTGKTFLEDMFLVRTESRLDSEVLKWRQELNLVKKLKQAGKWGYN